MAQPVIWSDVALNDIDGIADYISRDAFPQYAALVIDKILTAGESLAEQAQRGRIVPEIGSSHIRELFVYSYRVIYEVRSTQIEILAVIHGGRLLENSGRF